MPVSRRFADVGVGVEAEDCVEVAEVEVANVAVADIDDGLSTTRKAHHVAKSVDEADESPMSSANFLSRRRVSADLRRRNAPHMGREGEPTPPQREGDPITEYVYIKIYIYILC